MAQIGDIAGSGVDALGLVAGVVAGDPAAVDLFLDLGGSAIWSAVVALEGDGPTGEAAFMRVLDWLRANGWFRLKAFDGRASLATWLTLRTREALIEELPLALTTRPEAAWRRFERIFARDIRRRISRRFPKADQAERDDLFQDVSMGLIADDYHRLLAFSGRGSFEGFVLTLIDRLLIDRLRKEAVRRRLPADVMRLGDLDQTVFRLAAWGGSPMEPQRLLERLGAQGRTVDVAEVAAALARVRQAIEAERTRRAFGDERSIDAPTALGGIGESLVSPERGPADALLDREQEAEQNALVTAIAEAAREWPDEERLYLQTFLSCGGPPRMIAQMMSRPVEDIRQIQQRVMRRMRQIARTMQIASASVLGPEE